MLTDQYLPKDFVDGLIILLFVVLTLIAVKFLFYEDEQVLKLKRSLKNPILEPKPENFWESEAVFNPGAWYDGEKFYLLYRALGPDGISRIGYAESTDGINFKRLPHPAYDSGRRNRTLFTSPARLHYNPYLWVSGGGWGGSEDPRMVEIDGRVYVTFNIFNGWYSMRVGLLSMSTEDFKNHRWNWKFNFLSPHGRHKNWVLFPEKIGGKFAIFHNLFHENPRSVRVEFFDEIELPEALPDFESPDPHHVPQKKVAWHTKTRSAGPPPIKTPEGWLLLYHAMDMKDPNHYKVGAMLLDLDDPRKVLSRSARPILEPKEWYEHDWKPGIVYSTGAVVKNGILYVYYGGGDKRVNVATIPLEDVIRTLLREKERGEEKPDSAK